MGLCGCGFVVCMWAWQCAVVGVVFSILSMAGAMFLDECGATNESLAIFNPFH